MRLCTWMCTSRPNLPIDGGMTLDQDMLCAELPHAVVCDAQDLAQMARQCTCPRLGSSYQDCEEVKSLIAEARRTNDKESWKLVHKMRRKGRREWEQQRLAKILHGDWYEFSLPPEREETQDWLVGSYATGSFFH